MKEVFSESVYGELFPPHRMRQLEGKTCSLLSSPRATPAQPPAPLHVIRDDP